MTNFKVGQKVVCISKLTPESQLKVGSIYTIKAIDRCRFSGKLGFLLFEATPIPSKRLFDATRFRALEYNDATAEILEKFKLTEEKSDVEIKEYENA